MHIMSPKGHDMHTLTCILGRKSRGTGVLLLLQLLLLLLPPPTVMIIDGGFS